MGEPVRRWWDYAACNGKPTEWWFPSDREIKRIRAAKTICRGCPVRVDCLIDAVELDSEGVWGATTRQERVMMVSILGSKSALLCLHSGTLPQQQEPDTDTQFGT